jgi:hypothetical protein
MNRPHKQWKGSHAQVKCKSNIRRDDNKDIIGSSGSQVLAEIGAYSLHSWRNLFFKSIPEGSWAEPAVDEHYADHLLKVIGSHKLCKGKSLCNCRGTTSQGQTWTQPECQQRHDMNALTAQITYQTLPIKSMSYHRRRSEAAAQRALPCISSACLPPPMHQHIFPAHKLKR